MAIDLTLRSVKGTPLTHSELDGNFTSLKNGVLNATKVVDGIKNLVTDPSVLQTTKGFYVGSESGSASYYYDPNKSKTLHNGGTVIAPEALSAWNGSAANIATLLNWAGTGVGCFVLTNFDHIKITYFGGLSGSTQTDCGYIANHIFTKYGSCDLHFPRGSWYVATGIRINRGCSIIGESVFDDQTASKLVKAPELNQPVIATEKYYGGVMTHYYSIQGICIEGNRLTKTVASTMKEAIAFWGVFVGSYIHNVFVLNNFGAGISFEYSYDCKIGLLWINGCEVGDGAAVEIDQQLHNPGGPTGLLEFDSLYTENMYRSSGAGDPRTNPDNRGHGVKAGMIYRLNIDNLHQESCDAGVFLTHGVCYAVSIQNHSVSWCGRTGQKMAAHYWATVPQIYKVGGMVIGDDIAGYAFFDCTTDVFNGGQVARIPVGSTSRWGGMNFVSLAGQKAEIYGFQCVGSEVRRAIGNQQTTYGKKQIQSDDINRYHYEKAEGDYWTFGSTSKQTGNAETHFFRIESYGNAGDRVRFLKPFTIPTLSVTDFTDALYITPAGELRIRIGSGTYKINLTAV